MLPNTLPPEAPASERYVYGRLHASLPTSWTVIHGRRFLIPGRAAEPAQEGELDFLVMDPARGIMGLEVKGGGVERTRTGWYSTDRAKHRHPMKDPGIQASSAMHAVHRYLARASAFGGAGHRVHFGWGVLFPDIDVHTDLGPDLPRKVIIDRSDLASLDRALNRLYDVQGVNGPSLTEEAQQALVDTLLPTCSLVPSLAARFQQEGEALIRLTEEQTSVLEMLEANHRVAIEGAAGTGKTLLALEKARRLAGEGQRTLLLCFNRPLAHELNRSAEGFEVETFHGLCHNKAQRAQVPFHVPSGRQQQRFWEDDAPMLLLEALEALPDDRYDAVVVDEGQDFRENWWPSIEELLRDCGAGTFYVFFDPHQDLYGGGPPKALDVHPTRLVYNCRNTSQIATYACAQVGTESRVRLGSPTGAAVEEISCPDEAALVEEARKVLHRLVVGEKIRTDRIVVLSTHATNRSALARHRQLDGVQLVSPDTAQKPGSVVFTSLHRFKGLEADVILLTDVREGEATSSPQHLYVGASRARHLLVVLKLRPDEKV